MQESDVTFGRELAVAGMLHESCHRLAGIAWIEQDSFCAPEQLDRFPAGIGRHRIARTHVVGNAGDILGANVDLEPEDLRTLLGGIAYQLRE